MQCNDVQSHLLARRNGLLSSDLAKPIDEHLAVCASCQAEERADEQLSRILKTRLNSFTAPAELKQALRMRYVPRRAWLRSSLRTTIPLVAGAAIAAAVMAFKSGANSMDTMIREATNDHLRILYSEHPLDVVSASSHTVKPWFAGRIDFAPVVNFEGDSEFSLQGGSIAYFIDRKAAVYHYRCRLHVLSLFVFRADGLAWPFGGFRSLESKSPLAQSSRGFNTLLWRKGDLGYALVSDIDRRDLEKLGGKLSAGQ
jgi:anti-sigma factor RsiW